MLRSIIPRGLVAIFAHVSFGRFVVVGGTGFLIDATILLVLTASLNANPLLARLASFFVAVLATWVLNRVWTFGSRGTAGPLAEFARYLAVQLSGGVINVAVYAAGVLALPNDPMAPLIALAVGSAIALTANYVGARFIAFRTAASSK
jgi:putative flippase GtrA